MGRDFAIHSNILGSNLHYLSNGQWVKEIPHDYWIVGKNISWNKDLLTAFYLDGIDIKISPPEKFIKIVRNFTYKEDIPWEMVMPSHAFKDFVDSVCKKIYKAFGRTTLSYYQNIYKPACEVLDALHPMRIHRKRWRYLAERNIKGINSVVINSFEPNEEGFANPIKYSLTSTVSGRLKVIEGPEILRLNKELKSIIKSRYKGGKIIQFDYISLEPRLALLLAGHNVVDDVYSYINDMVFRGELERDIVKVSTLSVMFGAGAKSLSEKTGFSMTDCKSIIKQLKEFFNFYDLSKKLSKEYRSKKVIRNYFGRAIYPESGAGHKLYNHYIQSSAVDAAMLGFRNIVNLIDGVVPIFIIHDNIGLDFPAKLITKENLELIKEEGSKIPKLDGKLLLGSDSI